MGSKEDIALGERQQLIKTLVKRNFGREVLHVAPLGRDSNNYVYLVSLVEDASSSNGNHIISLPKPGTKVLSQSVHSIVVRLSNPDAMLNNAIRVENEVAAITLMRKALSKFPSKIVPDVYAWNSATEEHCWIVEEYMPGESLSARFPSLSESQKEVVMDQIAQIFNMIQSYELPPTLKGFGGLNFDGEGDVVTGSLTIWFGGPFDSYTDMYQHIFRKQMELSQTTLLVNGWKGTDLGERLQKFESEGFTKLLEQYSKVKPTLVHGDLSLENILIDPETLQITGLLDFDFTHIASPGDEYFYSFMDFHGLVAGPYEDAEMETLRLAQLSDFKHFEVPVGDAEVDWVVARMWQVAMKKFGVQTPAGIEGIEELAALYWFLLDVCPPYFLLPRWQRRKTEEQQEEAKKEVEANLNKYLKRWGY